MTSFGVVVSGRPVLTAAETISPTQFAFQIPAQPTFSHIVVFLLPDVVLPEGTAAAVYAQLPGASEFVLLGAIANEKPSAIFKINTKAGESLAGGGPGMDDAMVDEGVALSTGSAGASTMGDTVALGISIEPAQQVAASLEAKKMQAPSGSSSATIAQGGQLVLRDQNTVTTKVLAQRIIKNCYDFLTSWGSGDTVPLKAFQAWWTKFESKIERDPGFLERSDGG